MIGRTQIVGGFGVPHTPHYPSIVANGGPGAEQIARLYGEVRTRLERARPDVIVFYTCDHYNVFWETSIPIFSVGVAGSAWGASDYDTMPRREQPIASDLAHAVQRRLVRAGFDAGKSQEFELDHTIIAPMHFLMPDAQIPILPIFLSALIPPLPTAPRCRAFGEAVRDALEQEDAGRVAVVTSGSFSLEIAGPRTAEGSHVGVPAPAWMERVLELLGAGDLDGLVAEST
jgi:hypothetical protein